jgi:multiple antibiotic resistance protein
MPSFRPFLEVFIPLFVAIDAFGLVPVFLAVTGEMSATQRRRVTFQAVFTAMGIATGFMFLGHAIFSVLGITENDFRIAGGVLLLVLAVLDLLRTGKPAVHEPEIVGIVPLAMPLIAGPATLTTVLIMSSRPEYGYAVTLLSLLVNFAILLAVMLAAGRIERAIGTNALRAFSKLVMVLLAAIAVNFIRTGIGNIVRDWRR